MGGILLLLLVLGYMNAADHSAQGKVGEFWGSAQTQRDAAIKAEGLEVRK